MTTGQERAPARQVAQPADEEIKKHGDQLQKPLDGAAGKTTGDKPEPEHRHDAGARA